MYSALLAISQAGNKQRLETSKAGGRRDVLFTLELQGKKHLQG